MTAFYEAVILYAMALNETLAEGYNITSGSVITSKMWNRTYTGLYLHTIEHLIAAI